MLILPYLSKRDLKRISRIKNAIDDEKEDRDAIYIWNYPKKNSSRRLFYIAFSRVQIGIEMRGILEVPVYDGKRIECKIYRCFDNYNFRKLKEFESFEDFINFYKKNNSRLKKEIEK